jgi:hypothetical protein
MGSPQQPSTTAEECAPFDATAEKALIPSYIEADKAVIGVGVGDQDALAAELVVGREFRAQVRVLDLALQVLQRFWPCLVEEVGNGTPRRVPGLREPEGLTVGHALRPGVYRDV